MLRGLLQRSRLLSGCGCALTAAVLAGCSTTAPAPTVGGKTLTLYVSAPSTLTSDPQSQDTIDAETLAFNQLKGQVGGFTLRLRVLKAPKISDNARTAINDSTSVAYLGEVKPGASTDSLGITNAQDLLQVSPAQQASVPTNAFESYSTYGRTFASMAPGQDPRSLLNGSAGKTFVHDFRGAYGHAPSSPAIFGYVAMAAAVKALQKAGAAANNRGTVRTAFFSLKNTSLVIGPGGPALGTYTVSKTGTITITAGSG